MHKHEQEYRGSNHAQIQINKKPKTYTYQKNSWTFAKKCKKIDTKSGSVFHTSCASSISELKHTCIAPLDTIESFEVSDSVAFVPPLSQVLSTNEVKSLEVIYAQLYPSKQVEFISHFYIHASKSVIAKELVGSICSCSKKASVIGAYWPSKGSSSTTDYTKL